MPKITYNFESEEKIPAEFKPFANGTTVVLWANKDDDALASETNPALAAKNQELLDETKKAKAEADALKKVATDDTLDKAKLLVERDAALRQAKSTEEVEILDTFRNVFKDTPLSEVKTKLPTLLTDSEFAAQARKDKEMEKLFEVSGFKNKTVFLDLVSNPSKLQGVEGNLLIETVEGSDKRAIFANVKNAQGVIEKKNFNDYVKANPDWQPYIPALMTGGTVNENQTWIGQNPNLDGGDAASKPEWQKRTEAANASAKASPNPFQPNALAPAPSNAGQQK